MVNASAEIAKAQSYPSVRLFTAGLNTSATPLSELVQVLQPWSVGSSGECGRERVEGMEGGGGDAAVLATTLMPLE